MTRKNKGSPMLGIIVMLVIGFFIGFTFGDAEPETELIYFPINETPQYRDVLIHQFEIDRDGASCFDEDFNKVETYVSLDFKGYETITHDGLWLITKIERPRFKIYTDAYWNQSREIKDITLCRYWDVVKINVSTEAGTWEIECEIDVSREGAGAEYYFGEEIEYRLDVCLGGIE